MTPPSVCLSAWRVRREFAFVTGATYLYYARFLEADELSYGDQGLKWEGLLPSLTVFLLMWILSFHSMGHVLLNIA
ncbi:unnamed protein product [Ectocarpus sp. CCAP 1310/34]|nr:unnamed protein product [Ectocarpus sp. CCAP 1310/34]